jgi:hypothetical protein
MIRTGNDEERRFTNEAGLPGHFGALLAKARVVNTYGMRAWCAEILTHNPAAADSVAGI